MAAADWDTYVLVHAYTDETVIRSLEAGVMCIDHGHMMSERGMKMLVEKGAFLVTNLSGLSPELLKHPVYGQGVIGAKTREYQAGSDQFYDLIKKLRPKLVYGTDVVASDLYTSRKFRDHNL